MIVNHQFVLFHLLPNTYWLSREILTGIKLDLFCVLKCTEKLCDGEWQKSRNQSVCTESLDKCLVHQITGLLKQELDHCFQKDTGQRFVAM